MKKVKVTRRMLESYVRNLLLERSGQFDGSEVFSLKNISPETSAAGSVKPVVVAEDPNFLTAFESDVNPEVRSTGFGNRLENAAVEMAQRAGFVTWAMNDGTVATTFADVEGYEPSNFVPASVTAGPSLGVSSTTSASSPSTTTSRTRSSATKIYFSVKARAFPDSYTSDKGIIVTSRSDFAGFMQLLENEASDGKLKVGDVIVPGYIAIAVNSSVTDALNYQGIGFMCQAVASRGLHAIYHGQVGAGNAQQVFSLHGTVASDAKYTATPRSTTILGQIGSSGTRRPVLTATSFIHVLDESAFDPSNPLAILTDSSKGKVLEDIPGEVTNVQQFMEAFCNDGRNQSDIPVQYFAMTEDLEYVRAELNKTQFMGAEIGFSTNTKNQQRNIDVLMNTAANSISRDGAAIVRNFIQNMRLGNPSFNYPAAVLTSTGGIRGTARDFNMSGSPEQAREAISEIGRKLKEDVETKSNSIKLRSPELAYHIETFKTSLKRLLDNVRVVQKPVPSPSGSTRSDEYVEVILPPLFVLVIPAIASAFSGILNMFKRTERDSTSLPDPGLEQTIDITPAEEETTSGSIEVQEVPPVNNMGGGDDKIEDPKKSGGKIDYYKFIKESKVDYYASISGNDSALISVFKEFFKLLESEDYTTEAKEKLIEDFSTLLNSVNDAIELMIKEVSQSNRNSELQMQSQVAVESRLYESILHDLMEAAAKKQRAAQRPKKIKITKRQLGAMLNEMFGMDHGSYDIESSIRVALSVVPLTFEELYKELTLDPMYGDQMQSDFAEELSDAVNDMISRGKLTRNPQTDELQNALY